MTFIDKCSFSCRLFYKSFKQNFSAGRSHMDIKKENAVKSPLENLEVSTVPPIVSLYRQALVTFDDKKHKDFATNFTKLKTMVNSLRAEDLNFDKSLISAATWKKPDKAPCTYIEVFQNHKINMSVFILKPGFTMPLHDHPQMHGLLKVIYGSVNIRSFSEYPLKEVMKKADIIAKAKLEASRIAQSIHKRRRLYAEVTQDRVASDNTEACILTPTISNYHEISSVEGPAAFFDVLAPPYDTFIKGIGPRRCHYYKIVNEISTNVVELQETEVPECFYCDQAPYLGPILS